MPAKSSSHMFTASKATTQLTRSDTYVTLVGADWIRSPGCPYGVPGCVSEAAIQPPDVAMPPAWYPKPDAPGAFTPVLQVPQGTLIEAGAPREAAAVQLQPGMLPPPGGTMWPLSGRSPKASVCVATPRRRKPLPVRRKPRRLPCPVHQQEEDADMAEALAPLPRGIRHRYAT